MTSLRRDLLGTLEQILDIQATDQHAALDQATDIISRELSADKVDIFLYDPSKASLIARGTSDTPLGRKQKALGLDHLPLANGGRTVIVYRTGQPFLTGHLENDPEEVPGIKEALGVRSRVSVPLDVAGERRGTLELCSRTAELWAEADLRFLNAVARWISALLHRLELIENLRAGAVHEGRLRAAEELFAALAHDLRNLLAPLRSRIAIIGERARRDGRDADVRDAGLLDAGTMRLLRLVESLLDVSRLEKGLFSIEQKPVTLAALARQAVAAFSSSAVSFVERFGVEGKVHADPQRLQQAIENLVGNAVKHSPPGGVVMLDIQPVEREDGPWCVLKIVDQGPGVAPELLPHIFRRFVAGKASSGLGIGLYLAHGIVDAHGGSLTVHSKPGAGATFEIALPAAG